MTESTVRPDKITKPIQLLGAWLAGLFSIDSCFLFAAANMQAGSWEAKVLIVAAILNVPIFLVAVFLLQTKFRPELQEDSYYSTYLSRRTNEPITITKEDARFAQLHQKLVEIESRIAVPKQEGEVINEGFASLAIGVNKYLPDRARIGAKLSELGVIGYSTFAGSTPPEGRIVSISQYLPKKVMQDVIKVSRDLGFHHYSIFDNEGEETEEDVLFGSYGEAKYSISLPIP
ncbi:MAG TPA: hypothetical protein VK149_13040 [Sideroxyarcus sp.]|nr:hypothetical protein [Sideroxyarcus sp.]